MNIRFRTVLLCSALTVAAPISVFGQDAVNEGSGVRQGYLRKRVECLQCDGEASQGENKCLNSRSYRVNVQACEAAKQRFLARCYRACRPHG
jgi:hypothetical protein